MLIEGKTLCTYSLGFFFGPGLPLTLGTPSGGKATPELLFTPFFLTPSAGGGIDEGPGVPLAAGVFELDSDAISPFELAATARVFEVADEESFEGDSSLMAGGANLCRILGATFKTMTFEGFDDFRRGTVADDGFDAAML